MHTYADRNYQDFLQQNRGRGEIKVQLIIEGGALPVEDTYVVLNKIIDGRTYWLDDGYTDSCGIVEFHELPCLSREYSLQPDAVPYAGIIYQITMSHTGFGSTTATMPVFDQVKTIHHICPMNNFSNHI